jgi:hypothetical protein
MGSASSRFDRLTWTNTVEWVCRSMTFRPPSDSAQRFGFAFDSFRELLGRRVQSIQWQSTVQFGAIADSRRVLAIVSNARRASAMPSRSVPRHWRADQ